MRLTIRLETSGKTTIALMLSYSFWQYIPAESISGGADSFSARFIDLFSMQQGGMEHRHRLCSKASIVCMSWGMYEVLRRGYTLSGKKWISAAKLQKILNEIVKWSYIPCCCLFIVMALVTISDWCAHLFLSGACSLLCLLSYSQGACISLRILLSRWRMLSER